MLEAGEKVIAGIAQEIAGARADLSKITNQLESQLAPGHYGSKTRYRQADSACQLAAGANGAFHLDFSDPQWAVTPGQSAVLYDGDICLGGGVIASKA